MRFEKSVISALDKLPLGFWQRIDGLLCEKEVLHLPEYSKMFCRTRLRLMEFRGIIESTVFGSFWPSCNNLKSYRLKEKNNAIH